MTEDSELNEKEDALDILEGNLSNVCRCRNYALIRSTLSIYYSYFVHYSTLSNLYSILSTSYLNQLFFSCTNFQTALRFCRNFAFGSKLQKLMLYLN